MENIATCRIVKMIGTSLESKPTNVSSGSEFYETDTGTTYIYNINTLAWSVKSTHNLKIVDGKPRYSSMPYLYDVAEGNVANHTSWAKIGFNAAIGATEEEMWPVSGAYVFPTGELTMTVVSDSAKDCQRAITAFADSATSPGAKTTATCTGHGLANADTVIITGTTSYNGTFALSNVAENTFDIVKVFVANDATGTVQGPGANTITIYYLDGNFAEKTVTKTFLGTTSVQVGTDCFRVQNARIATAGTSLYAVGNITIAQGGTTYGYISAGRTRMRQCTWTVPAGKVLFVTQITFACADQAAGKYARFTTKANFDNLSGAVLQRGLWSPYNEVILNNTGYFRELNPPTKLPATVDLKVSALANSAAAGTCSLRGWVENA